MRGLSRFVKMNLKPVVPGVAADSIPKASLAVPRELGALQRLFANVLWANSPDGSFMYDGKGLSENVGAAGACPRGPRYPIFQGANPRTRSSS